MANTTFNIPLHESQPAFYSGAKVRQSEVTFEYTGTAASLALVANTSGNSASCHSLVENTSGSNTVTLPTAVGIPGYFFTVKNTGSGTVTLATTGGQTIDGASTQSLSQYTALQVVSNGTNWIII